MKKYIIGALLIIAAAVIAVKYFIKSVKGAMVKLTFLIDGGARQSMYFPIERLSSKEQNVGNAMGVKANIYTEGEIVMLKVFVNFNQYGVDFNVTKVLRLATLTELREGYIQRDILNALGHTFSVRVELANLEPGESI